MSTLSFHKKEDQEKILNPIEGKSLLDIKKELLSKLNTQTIINA